MMKYWSLFLVAGLCSCSGGGTAGKQAAGAAGKVETVVTDRPDVESDTIRHECECWGEVCIAHEVRSFRPSGSNKEYWLVDKTGTLTDIYDRKTGGQKNGKPLRMKLKLEYQGKWDDGFAAEYDGVFFVREVLEFGETPETE